MNRYPSTKAEWDALPLHETMRAALALAQDVRALGFRHGREGKPRDARFDGETSLRGEYRAGYEAGRNAGRSGRRHFYFWCTACRTVLHVETAEGTDVCAIPDEPACAVCSEPTRDYDVLAAFGDTPMNDGSWEAFETWRSTK